jgi:hypothetical protein
MQRSTVCLATSTSPIVSCGGHPPGNTPAEKESRAKELRELRQMMAVSKGEIAAAQWTIEFYKPQSAAHGYVWLFLRKAPVKGQPQSHQD